MKTIPRESELCLIALKEGYRIISDPKTVFIPYQDAEGELSSSLLSLRDDYGYMIQTEIT